LLKTNKNADLAIEIWHNIFDFAANNDQGESMIISNDFHSLLQRAGANLSTTEADQIFSDTATRQWGQHTGMDLDNFSLAVESLAAKAYREDGEEAKFRLLINVFFYNLAEYEEFNNFMIEKKTKHRITKNELRSSPFQQSYQRYKSHLSNKNNEGAQYVKKVNQQNSTKLVEEAEHRMREQEEVEVKEEKGPSCKRRIYESLNNCCRKEES
jgi:hypothetical protein